MFSALTFLVKSALAGKVPGKRPVVVIESDDWGTIRMPSKKVYEKLKNQNPAWVNDPYLTYDSLESNEDLEALYGVLTQFKDAEGRHPVITANCVAGNPDFERIKHSAFNTFFWEDFRETLKRYPESDRVYDLEKQGMQEGFFVPQFHAREHIQASRWIQALRTGNIDLKRAFDLEMISYAQVGQNTCASFFMDAFNAESTSNLEEITAICMEGLDIFRQTWGLASSTLIAPCYYWHPAMEEKLLHAGVRAFQGIRVQKASKLNGNPADFNKVYHFNGECNRQGQYYFVRNCFFEPSLDPVKYGSEACLKQVDSALKKSGLAIISAHRLNFIGRIDKGNRDRNLQSFSTLLAAIVKQYPAVRFLSSSDLLKLYQEHK